MVSENHKLKEKQVKELADKIKKSKTLMVVSIKGLPSRQFQDIKKSVREEAHIQVAKKNILIRSIKAVGSESILPVEKYISENCAFAISDVEGFELAGILSRKKNPMFAKAGQIAPEDIEVKKGPTELVPGPAISELGSVGLQISVENGKIAVRQDKVIVHKGKEISGNVASILQKLNIRPFSVGLVPLIVYDVKAGKLYTEIHINTDEAVGSLKEAAGRALGFAQSIRYYCKETIGYFLAKANAEGNAIDAKIGGNN